MSHGSGLYIMAHVMRRGINVVPESGGFDPEEIFALCAPGRARRCSRRPTMVKRLVDCPAECPSDNIRTVVYGGAPMYVEDAIRALDRFGPRFAQIYGQGESPMTISVLPKARDRRPRASALARAARLGRAGPTRASKSWWRTTATGRCPAGADGEILVRGDTVMARLLGQPAGERVALSGGWLHTGDVGAFDADGYLTLKDRSKDLIISGGSNIYPREVEEVLLRHPGVREVSVIGRSDREWGEAVVAYVVGEAPWANSTRCAWPRSRASSGRRTTYSSRRCPRTTTARCSRPSCARASCRCRSSGRSAPSVAVTLTSTAGFPGSMRSRSGRTKTRTASARRTRLAGTVHRWDGPAMRALRLGVRPNSG
jgi:acyl-CoA synthetase (AMP-forming)/AMP-acid ligase II